VVWGSRSGAVIAIGLALSLSCGPRISESARRQAQTRAQLAASMLLEGEFTTALAEARRSVELDPDCVDCKLTLGTIYAARAEWSQAETSMREVLEAEPDNPFALNTLATVYLNTGRPAEAEPLAQRASENEVYSGRHLAFYNIGWSRLQRQQYRPALEAFGEAIREMPDMCLAHYRVGEVFFRLRQYEDALDHLEQAVAPREDRPIEGDQDRQIQTCGDMPDAQHMLGMTLVALGREEESRAAFERCAQLATPRTDLGRRCAQQTNGQVNDGDQPDDQSDDEPDDRPDDQPGVVPEE
jgi:Tfp pilus assembly protein PilF